MVFSTKVLQRPLPSERKVCPNCLSVTDHVVVENDTRLAFYSIPLLSLNRNVTYTCSSCGDSHSVDFAEYLAAHPSAETVAEKTPPETASNPSRTPKVNSSRDKARTILEGKIVGDQIQTTLPLLRPSAGQILKWLYIGFAIIAALAIIILIIISVITSG